MKIFWLNVIIVLTFIALIRRTTGFGFPSRRKFTVLKRFNHLQETFPQHALRTGRYVLQTMRSRRPDDHIQRRNIYKKNVTPLRNRRTFMKYSHFKRNRNSKILNYLRKQLLYGYKRFESQNQIPKKTEIFPAIPKTHLLLRDLTETLLRLLQIRKYASDFSGIKKRMRGKSQTQLTKYANERSRTSKEILVRSSTNKAKSTSIQRRRLGSPNEKRKLLNIQKKMYNNNMKSTTLNKWKRITRVTKDLHQSKSVASKEAKTGNSIKRLKWNKVKKNRKTFNRKLVKDKRKQMRKLERWISAWERPIFATSSAQSKEKSRV